MPSGADGGGVVGGSLFSVSDTNELSTNVTYRANSNFDVSPLGDQLWRTYDNSRSSGSARSSFTHGSSPGSQTYRWDSNRLGADAHIVVA